MNTVTATRTSMSLQARARLLAARGEPLLIADWHRVLMLHVEVEPAILQQIVPFPLDRWEGRTFVSLVAFTLRGLRPRFGGAPAAWLFKPIATHHFLNVRTYVVVKNEPGIHFLAEWLSNRLAVRLGPPTFALPYRQGRIAYHHDWTKGMLSGSVEDSLSGRRLTYSAAVDGKAVFKPCARETLDEWLMERYSAFNSASGLRRQFRVWHKPWEQCTAEAKLNCTSLLEDYWPWMAHAPLIGTHFSPGAESVWMGRPRRIDLKRSWNRSSG